MSQSNKTEEEFELDKYHDLKALADHPGGKILVESLLSDVVAKVDTLAGNYREFTHIEIIAHLASLNEKLTLLRALTRAENNHKELSEALQA